MGCCTSVTKSLIFLINFIFFLVSLALIGIGAYIHVNMTQYLDFLGETYLNSSIVLIIVGVVIAIVSFFGCCGAMTEKPCMIYTSGTLLLLITITLIGVGITIYVFKDQVKEIVTEKMNAGMQNYNKPDFKGVTETWDIIQQDLKCCGVTDYKDWKGTTFGASGDLPDSCCITSTDGCGKGKGNNPDDKIFIQGCFSLVEEVFVDNAAVTGGIGVGVVLILILGVIATCCVGKKLSDRSNYA